MNKASGFFTVKSLVFNQENPLIVSNYVNERIGRHCIDPTKPNDKKSSLFYQHFGMLDLCSIQYGNPAKVASAGIGGCYHLQLILQGECQSILNEHKTSHRAGDIFIINPQDIIDLTYSSDCEKLIIKFPTALLNTLCTEQEWTYPSSGIVFDSEFQLSQDSDSILDLLFFICKEAESRHDNATFLKNCDEIVIRKLLDLFPSNIKKENIDPQKNIFTAIAKYIDNNIKNNISMDDLKKIAPNISQRTLYNIFKEYTDMTPTHFIKERKMECIQAELSTSGHSKNITSIAMDYGFFHLGRFSECYKKKFGVLPSDTIKLAKCIKNTQG